MITTYPRLATAVRAVSAEPLTDAQVNTMVRFCMTPEQTTAAENRLAAMHPQDFNSFCMGDHLPGDDYGVDPLVDLLNHVGSL